MAVSFTPLSNALASTSNTNSYAGNAGTPASGDLLICAVQVSDSTEAGGASFSLSGTWTWNLLTSFTYNGGADTLLIFWAVATAATSTTPTFSCTGDNGSGCIIDCWRITGAEGQTQPYLRQFKTSTGSVANPSITMDTAILTGNGVLAFASNKTNSAAQWTPPTNWTETANHETSYNTPTTSMEAAFRTSGETGTTISWTNANTTQWGIILLEFYVATSGPIALDSNGSMSGFFGGISSV